MKIQPFICFVQKIDLLSRLTPVYYTIKNLSTFFAKPSIFTINSSKFPQNDESRRQGIFRTEIIPCDAAQKHRDSTADRQDEKTL